MYESQTGLQGLIGGVADVSGVTALYMGMTGRDLATGYHHGLSDSQQRPLVTVGAIWFLVILLFLGVAVRVGLMTFREPHRPAKKKEEIRQIVEETEDGYEKGNAGSEKRAVVNAGRISHRSDRTLPMTIPIVFSFPSALIPVILCSISFSLCPPTDGGNRKIFSTALAIAQPRW